MICILCDGPLVLLGQLGSKAWFRCRDCGIDQSLGSGDFEELSEWM